MKILIRLFLGLVIFVVVVVIAFAVATQFFPASYKVTRSTVIRASQPAVFAEVGDLKRWAGWSVWEQRDPQMVSQYSDLTTGVGAWHSWVSKTEGSGKMTFTVSEPGKLVGYDLEFPDFGMKSRGLMELAPEGNDTKVTWICEGEVSRNPVQRLFGVLMDKMVGPDFEKGLAGLKKVTEKP